jgi:hypothetical protein
MATMNQKTNVSSIATRNNTREKHLKPILDGFFQVREKEREQKSAITLDLLTKKFFFDVTSWMRSCFSLAYIGIPSCCRLGQRDDNLHVRHWEQALLPSNASFVPVLVDLVDQLDRISFLKDNTNFSLSIER